MRGPEQPTHAADDRRLHPHRPHRPHPRPRTRLVRQGLVHAILDEGYVCHLGFVRDGAPVVLPTLYGRVGDPLYVHGSTGSRPLRMTGQADPGLPVCLTVTHVDALILARSAFHHSINYRSVVVHGIAHEVTDPEEQRAALDALVDHVVPGRAARLPAGQREGAGRHRRDPPRPERGLRQDPHRRRQRRARGPRPPPLGRRRPAPQGLRAPRSPTPTWPPAPNSRTTSGPCSPCGPEPGPWRRAENGAGVPGGPGPRSTTPRRGAIGRPPRTRQRRGPARRAGPGRHRLRRPPPSPGADGCAIERPGQHHHPADDLRRRQVLPSSTHASTVATTASRHPTTPATCGDSRRTATTPVTYATTVAISTIHPSSSTPGHRAVHPRLPVSTAQSIPHGRATTVSAAAPISSPYAMTPSGSGASVPASLPWSDRTKYPT